MMAAFRGAKVDANTLTLYAVRIAKEIPARGLLQDAIAAIEKLADLERKEGELAFPDIATVLGMFTVVATARLNREARGREKQLVRWRCPECGIFKSGFIAPDDSQPRICGGNQRIAPKRVSSAEICGAVMTEIHREAAQ
jgi:hypothetical protein